MSVVYRKSLVNILLENGNTIPQNALKPTLNMKVLEER
jgi:hypothetical protein